MSLAQTYRRRLHELALDQYGYVTTRDAEELGVPAVELRKLAQRGGLRNVAYGLYRFEDVPAGDHDQFMEAVLRAGPDAFLTRDAVLAFHELGLVNPRRIRVGTPGRVRAALPNFMEVVHERLRPEDRTAYEGIPSATVARALRDCKGVVMGDRLAEAFREAKRRGLLRKDDAARLATDLEIVA